MTNETFSTGTAYSYSLLQLPLMLSGTHGHTNQWSQGFDLWNSLANFCAFFAVWTDLDYWSPHLKLIIDSQATSVPENMSLRVLTAAKCLIQICFCALPQKFVRAPPRRNSPYGLPQGFKPCKC